MIEKLLGIGHRNFEMNFDLLLDVKTKDQTIKRPIFDRNSKDQRQEAEGDEERGL